MKIETEIGKRIEKILHHLNKGNRDYVVYHLHKIRELIKDKRWLLQK